MSGSDARAPERGSDPVAPRVSVIIPYYENPAGLAQVLAGIAAQTYPGEVEVIVADDGSATPPEVPAHVRVVRQEDLGFRAAAARNLGAAHASGEVLAFLDGDTIPEPGYLEAVVARLVAEPEVLVVGSRRHLVVEEAGADSGDERASAADRSSTPARLAAGYERVPAGTSPVPGERVRDLGEPAWLRDAWGYTDDLRAVDDTGFRFVISAVLSCTRAVFERVGGFDGTIVGYGGEDWEFAWQAWLAGCEFRHEPGAQAVHLGADWGGRAEDPARAIAEKNAETLALATRITHPTMRPAGVVFAVPDIAVRWAGETDPGVVVPVVAALLAAGDVHVELDAVPEVFAADPRAREVNGGEAAAEVTGQDAGARRGVTGEGPEARVRPRFDVKLLRPCLVPPGELQAVCEEVSRLGGCAQVLGVYGEALLRIAPRRALARGERQATTIRREWPVLTAPLRLEEEFREAARSDMS